MNELNKKLAEWVGFKRVENPTAWAKWAYNYPDGNPYSFKGFPNFTESLDACFKWLVPKLNKDYAYVLMKDWIRDAFGIREDWLSEIYKDCLLTRENYSNCIADGQSKDNPALALCLAIEKLIDRGEK